MNNEIVINVLVGYLSSVMLHVVDCLIVNFMFYVSFLLTFTVCVIFLYDFFLFRLSFARKLQFSL